MPAYPEYIVALGVGVASGLVPIVNVEAYLVGVAMLTSGDPSWTLALPAGVGQVAGKLVYYYVARGSLGLPAFLRRFVPSATGAEASDSVPPTWLARLTRAARRGPLGSALARWSARSARSVARWRANAEARPRWYMAMLGVSAFSGLPPFGVMSAVAGAIRLRVVGFLVISLPARCVRFSLLLLAPGIVSETLSCLGLG